VLCVLVPAAALFVVARKYFLQARAIIFGIVGFMLCSLVLDPLVSGTIVDILGVFGAKSVLPVILLLCLTSAIFEETARYAAFVLMESHKQGLPTALNYGIGHGSAQAIFLVGLSMLANVTTANMLNGGDLAMMTQDMPQENLAALQQTIEIYMATPPTQYLAAGVERIAMLPMQMGLSVLLYMASSRKKGYIWMWPFAIFMHAVVKVPAMLYEYGAITHVWLSVAATILLAAAVTAICVWQYKKVKSLQRG